MRQRISATIGLILLLTALPANWPFSYPVGSKPHRVTNSVSPEIEAQVQLIAALARRSASTQKPDPRFFGALVRLEEMLPRSSATRRAQEQGKHAYLAVLRSHESALVRKWTVMHAEIERQAHRDPVYQKALGALDQRLDAVSSDTLAVSGQGQTARRLRSLPFEEMRPGDVMLWDDRSGPPLIRLGVSLFARKCTHTAIYLGETRSPGRGLQRWTYEALNPKLGVRVSLMDRKWTRRGLHVSLGHIKGISPALGKMLVKQAVQKYGVDGQTPYHLWPPWDKTYYGEGLYCSQLVWTIYNHQGIDLDSNDWRFLVWFAVHNWYDPYAAPTAYFGVFPDEIKASSAVSWYYDQTNP